MHVLMLMNDPCNLQIVFPYVPSCERYKCSSYLPTSVLFSRSCNRGFHCHGKGSFHPLRHSRPGGGSLIFDWKRYVVHGEQPTLLLEGEYLTSNCSYGFTILIQ